MKKVMIGILVLIPIIIMLVVGAVTSFVTTRAHIAVDDIYFEFSEGETKLLELEFGKDYYNLSELLTVVVLPERASDKSFNWEMEDLICYDDDYNNKWQEGKVEDPAYLVDENGNPVEDNSTGMIKINSYCYFNIFVNAEGVSDKCLVYVGGSEIQSVTIRGDADLLTGQTSLLEPVYFPIDALITNVEWISSNPAVATVDGNGAVTAVSAGTAHITAKAYGKAQTGDDAAETPVAISDEYLITVSDNVTKYGIEVNMHTNSVTVSELNLKESITTYENCTVTGDTISVTNPDLPAVVTTEGGAVITLNVVGENDIAIKNAEMFSFDENRTDNFILATGDLSLKLNAVFRSNLLTNTPNVSWSSSVPAVARVDANGNVTGLKSGITTITATYGEGENATTASLLLAVEDKVTNLILDTTDASLAVGLARETVFASKKFVDVNAGTMENNSFEILFTRPVPVPGTESVFYNAYLFTVKDVTDGTERDTTKASFFENKLIFNSAEITDTVLLKITVSAKYPKYSFLSSYTTKSFTIKVVNGVTVGTDAELKKAASMNETVSLNSDIFVTNPGGLSNKKDFLIESEFSIYGNYKMISSKAEQFISRDSILLLLKGDNSIVSNVRIRVNEDIDEEISNGDEDMQKLLGVGVRFMGKKQQLGEENNLDSFRIEYSIVENCRMCVNILAGKLDCEGNIMRNCLEMAIWAPTDINEWGGTGVRYFDLTLKNNVFSNLISLSFSFTYDGYSDDPALAEQALAEGKNSKLNIIGFLDVYNWQELNILSMIPTSGVGSSFEEFMPLINSLLRDQLTSGEFFEKYRFSYNGVTYFHMGGMGTGLVEPCLLNLERNDETRFSEFTSEDFVGASGAMGILGNIELTRVWCYTNDVTDIVPQKRYIINNKLIDHLHGVGVEYPEGTPEYEESNN